jgi:hypothetical protein
MYLSRNIEMLSRNHCCSGKEKSVTYYECVSVALHNQQAMSMRHIVMRVLPGSKIVFHAVS